MQAAGVLVAASFLAVHILSWILPNVFEPWNARTFDRLLLFRSSLGLLRPSYDSTIVHVDISDKTLSKLRNAYLARSEFAGVVRNLAEMGAASQLWDFVFASRLNRGEDSMFIYSTSRAGNVYFGLAFRLSEGEELTPQTSDNSGSGAYIDRTKWSIKVEGNVSDFYQGLTPLGTFLELAEASKGLGHLNMMPDRDGVFRRVPLLVRLDDGFYPSISFRAICEYLNVLPAQIIVKPSGSITLQGAHTAGGTPHDIVIPIDRYGNMTVNYLGPWEAMKHYDFADVLRASDDRDELELMGEELRGKIVMVSQVTTGSADIGSVPTDHSFPKSGIHANLMHTILTENFLRELTDAESLVLEFLVMGIVLLLSFRFSSLSLSLSTILLVFAFVVTASLFFLFGNVIMNVIRPSLMIVVALFSIVAYRYVNEEKEKEVLRRSFEAYFPASVVKKIMANPGSITTAGQKKELTIMFTDIISFTTYSATQQPDQIQKMLNEYFEAMIDIVFEYGGTVDKLIGDGLMVFFGDPEPQPDHAVRCVEAAIEMQQKTRELKRRWQSEGKMPIQIRIGINSGTVIVGNMGSQRRLSYTVLGSDVNLAQRLERSAPAEGIIISERTCELVKDRIVTRPVGQIKVKGLNQPVTVYEVPVDGKVSD